jgi:hypothetical protein
LRRRVESHGDIADCNVKLACGGQKMTNPAGDPEKRLRGGEDRALRVGFEGSLKLEFHGSKVTSLVIVAVASVAVTAIVAGLLCPPKKIDAEETEASKYSPILDGIFNPDPRSEVESSP